MNNATIKSIGAILAGLVFGAVFSIVTDLILSKTGSMKQPFILNDELFICGVIIYRTAYNIAGCFITAILAPEKPMRHALILGSIGFLLNIAGAIAMWDIPPHWYPIALTVLALPSAWLGGKTATLLRKK